MHFFALSRLPWLLVALPMVAVHLSYLISAGNGYVPWCIPYIDGCTSISRAARHGYANILFKALMLPYAALLAVFWHQMADWLLSLRPDAGKRSRGVRLLGMTAALFLVLYTVFLGIDGEFYQWLRRYGITVFFGFSVLGQMLTLALLHPLLQEHRALRYSMFSFCGLLLTLGLLSLPLQHFSDNAKAAMNALEWIYAGLMTFFYALVGRAFRVNRLNLLTAVL